MIRHNDGIVAKSVSGGAWLSDRSEPVSKPVLKPVSKTPIVGHDALDTTRIYTQGTASDLQKEVEKIAWA